MTEEPESENSEYVMETLDYIRDNFCPAETLAFIEMLKASLDPNLNEYKFFVVVLEEKISGVKSIKMGRAATRAAILKYYMKSEDEALVNIIELTNMEAMEMLDTDRGVVLDPEPDDNPFGLN